MRLIALLLLTALAATAQPVATWFSIDTAPEWADHPNPPPLPPRLDVYLVPASDTKLYRIHPISSDSATTYDAVEVAVADMVDVGGGWRRHSIYNLPAPPESVSIWALTWSDEQSAPVVARLEQPPTPKSSIAIKSQGSAKEQPVTVSRFFAQGDIPDCAQAVIAGQPTDTQCNVMTRWPDGSVQHVLLSFWFSPSESTEVSFQNQPHGNDVGLTPSQMLSDEYNLSAVMDLDNGVDVLRANVRDILSAGDFRYWLSGPICTQVIIEDRGGRKHDLGWGEYKPFHPIFVATFYPGWNGVKVEMIGELAWTDTLMDLTYSLVLSVNDGVSTRVAYQKPEFTHHAMTRWRQVFWSGEEPRPVTIDLNFPYMIHSRAVPSYDLTKEIPQGVADNSYSSFLSGDRGDIGGNAFWTKYFPTSGGRREIGLFPAQYVKYLYTFTPELEEVMLGNAAVSGHVPIHLREGSPGRVYVEGSTEEALGRPLSLDSRPTVWSGALHYQYTAAEDKITRVKPFTEHGWKIDTAHQGSFAYIPYLVTGDWYFLEETYFWASWVLASANPCDMVHTICRVGSWGYVPQISQLRGVAWALRNIAHAALMAPDGSPEKTYYRNKLYNNIAVHEGFHDIRDGSFYEAPYRDGPDSPWEWGRRLGAKTGPNPLGFIPCSSGPDKAGTIPEKVGSVESPWAMNYLYVVLGHLDELGAPVSAWRRRLAVNLIDRFAHQDFNPYLVASYRMPCLDPGQAFFVDWHSVLTSYLPELQVTQAWPPGSYPGSASDGYVFVARAAAAFLPGLSNSGRTGESAWAWMNAHVENQHLLNADPKWAFVPRADSSTADPDDWQI